MSNMVPVPLPEDFQGQEGPGEDGEISMDEYNKRNDGGMKMGKLFKCDICGFIFEGEQPPAACPKCGVGPEHFLRLTDEEAKKIFSSDRTNDIHFELITLLDKMLVLCNEGIQINLDPNCVKAFAAAKDELWTIKGRSKAELAAHLSKGKW